jgi:hypothetical protein
VTADKFKKFIAFEWIMLWIFGFFWAAAMFLPLYLTGALKQPGELLKNVIIMGGPYAAYVIVRILFLLGKSLYWAYITSNFFFTTQEEKVFADEWLRFVLFVPFWGIIVAYPIYRMRADLNWFYIVAIVALPYMGYFLLRAFGAIGSSLGWALRVTTKK